MNLCINKQKKKKKSVMQFTYINFRNFLSPVKLLYPTLMEFPSTYSIYALLSKLLIHLILSIEKVISISICNKPLKLMNVSEISSPMKFSTAGCRCYYIYQKVLISRSIDEYSKFTKFK